MNLTEWILSLTPFEVWFLLFGIGICGLASWLILVFIEERKDEK